jgi:hypothetical protein
MDDAFSWRSLSSDAAEDTEPLAESQCPSVQASASGAALKAVPKLSKNLIAYIEHDGGAACREPLRDLNGPFGPHAKGFAEAAPAEAPKSLNKPFMAYLKQAQARGMIPRGPKSPGQDLHASNQCFKRTNPRQPATIHLITRPPVETTVACFCLIGKAFRPEFEARAA